MSTPAAERPVLLTAGRYLGIRQHLWRVTQL
jgi:hypothetical protein